MRQLWSGKFWITSATKTLQLFTVYLPVLLIDFAFSGIITNTSFYTSYLGLSSTFLGVLKAVMTGFFVVLAIPFGRLSDRIERRYVLYAACLVLGAVSIGLPYCRNSIHLMLIFPESVSVWHSSGPLTKHGLLSAKAKGSSSNG